MGQRSSKLHHISARHLQENPSSATCNFSFLCYILQFVLVKPFLCPSIPSLFDLEGAPKIMMNPSAPPSCRLEHDRLSQNHSLFRMKSRELDLQTLRRHFQLCCWRWYRSRPIHFPPCRDLPLQLAAASLHKFQCQW